MKSTEIWLYALALLLGGLILLLPIETVIIFLSDDAYYYAKVAMNNIAGLGLTFDGINATNGWHPLWMVMIHPIYWLGLDANLSLRLLLIAQLILYLISLRIIMLISGRFFEVTSRAALVHAGPIHARAVQLASIATLLFFVPVTVLGLNGLESALLVLTEMGLLLALLQYSSEPDVARNRLAIGLLLGLMFLSRLDTAFIIITVSCCLLALEWKAQRNLLAIVSRWWLPASISAALALPYVAWNLATHDHMTPISGTLKNTFPYPHFRVGFLPRVPHFVIGITLATTWFMYQYYKNRSNQNLSAQYGLLIAMAFGCLVHLIWSVVFMAWGTFQWHFVAQAPLIVIAVMDFVCRIPYQRTAAVAALLLAIAINLGSVGLRLGHHQERLEAAMWLNEYSQDEFRVGLRDAGIFGYFSNHQVVNLDGLINSYEFFAAINERKVSEFLEQSNVQYFADAYTPCDYQNHQINIVAHSAQDPRVVVGEIRMMKKADQIASFQTKKLFENLRLGDTCFVIWKGTGTPLPLSIANGTK